MTGYVCTTCGEEGSAVYHLYARLSPNPEGAEKEVASVDRQVRETHEYIHRLGGVVGKVYRDEGISATKANVVRPAFEETLELEEGDRLACWHSDRYIRTTRDLLRVIDRGFTVHALYTGHIDLSTPAGIAVAKTVTAWAEYEGQQKALRQQSAHRDRATSGRPWWNRRPFGFNPDGTAHPVEGPVVAQLYERALLDQNMSSLARWLNDQGFTTSAGKAWRGTGVRALLKGARNAAISTYHGREVGAANWDALVSEETYRATVALLGREERFSGGARLGQGQRLYLMTGFAQCGQEGCGKTVRIWWRGGKDHGYRVYGCPDGHASALGEWVDERAGALVIARFKHDPESKARITASEDEANADEIRAEIVRLERKGETYVAMLDDDLMSEEQFKTANKANMQKIAALRKELGKVGLSKALHSLLDVEDIEDHWTRKMSVAERYAVASNFFDRVEIMPRGRERVRGMRPGDVRYWIRGAAEPAL